MLLLNTLQKDQQNIVPELKKKSCSFLVECVFGFHAMIFLCDTVWECHFEYFLTNLETIQQLSVQDQAYN